MSEPTPPPYPFDPAFGGQVSRTVKDEVVRPVRERLEHLRSATGSLVEGIDELGRRLEPLLPRDHDWPDRREAEAAQPDPPSGSPLAAELDNAVGAVTILVGRVASLLSDLEV